MRFGVRLVLLAAAFAVGTVTFGWWSVAVLGLAWPLVVGPAATRAWVTAALAAGLGWGALLTAGAIRGPLIELAPKIGGAMSLPGGVLLMVTALFPMMLAGSGAAAVQWVMTFSRKGES